MSQDQDNNDDADPLPTHKEAIRARKERIAELRQGDKDERRLAKVLKRCSKWSRCNEDTCDVCQRCRELAERRIASLIASSWYSDSPSLQVKMIALDAVQVIGKRRPLNEEKLAAITASMKQIGLRTPITVRTKKKKVILVVGAYRLEAAKRLGMKEIPCFIIPDDETEGRLWELAENVYRAEFTVLERAEHIDEMRALIWKAKVVQVAPPGGKQLNDSGINRAAKVLGLTREEIRRSKKIAGISSKARAAARECELDDNQAVLLEIAALPTPEAQCKAIQVIDERKRAARARRAAAAVTDNAKAAAEIERIEASIADKLHKLDRLNDKVASHRKRVREIEDKLISNCVDDTLVPIDQSPSIVPDNEPEIPPASDEDDGEVPDPDLDQALADLQAAWDAAAELREAWDQAPLAVRKRFIAEVLRSYAS
jgi:ParB/RepB/Spo0J family partition protein